MRAESCLNNYQVSLVFCGDRRIRTLNRIWRGMDKATDVLSFSQLERAKGDIVDTAMSAAPTSPLLIGDVIISVETAARQAKNAGKILEEEILFLLTHGLLHLIGWDHKNDAQTRRMIARQKELLKHL